MAVRALVVGSLVMDLAFRVPTRPGPGEVIIATDLGTYRGGKGYNQAVALSRLGAEVTLVGAVGMDAYGDAFIEALEREGIDAGRVVQLRGTATAVARHCADLPDCDVLLLQGEVQPAASAQAGRVIHCRGDRVLLNPAPAREITEELLDLADVLIPNEVEARALLGDAAPED